ncbi:MAG: CRTAC1 family protein [Bryobacteraceae bacterium]
MTFPSNVNSPSEKAPRKRRTVLWLVGFLLLFAAGSLGFMEYSERAGLEFFENGKSILATLGVIGHAIKAGDAAALEKSYATSFKGTALGMNHLKAGEVTDGVHRFAFTGGGAADRDAAMAEWKSYIAGFESIEESALHIFRIVPVQAGEDLAASVRFEVIGKAKDSALASIDRAYFRMGFVRGSGGLQVVTASLMEGERTVGDRPLFTNVSSNAGIDFMNQYYPAFINTPQKFGMIRYGPAGITTADVDGDGFYDLFIPDGVESKLFRNTGDGRFVDITAKVGLAGLDGVSVGTFADYDNDGRKDFFVSRTYKPNQLFHQNADGTFTDVTKKSGIGEDCCTTVASWADYDNDGKLDLYVGRYLDPREAIPTTFYARNGLPNQLYHNNGDGTFTNVTAKSHTDEPGLCLGTVFGDINDDGYPDLYVVNDFGRKTLYRNNRDGSFTDITVKSGTLAYGAGMNASMGDYDNDGKLDLYCTNIRSDEAWYAEKPTVMRYMANSWRQGVWKSDMPLYFQIFQQSGTNFVGVFQQMASGNTLLRNRGDETFEDTTEKAHAAPPGWFWGASFADFDNDGWQDIYAANGWAYNDKDTEIELEFLNNVVSQQDVYKTGLFFDPKYFGRRSWHGWERKRYLRNRGDGTFEELGRATSTDILTNARGIAVADFWNRGLMDIAVSASTDKHVLLRNEYNTGRHWLQVELVGTQSNRDAVGARITMKNKGKLQMREIILGDGYGSQNSLRQHFGVADNGTVDEITVKWPKSGTTQTFKNVAADRIIEITEGKNDIVTKNYRRPAK